INRIWNAEFYIIEVTETLDFMNIKSAGFMERLRRPSSDQHHCPGPLHFPPSAWSMIIRIGSSG
ncbi:hypothetical protein, partial [Sphingobium sp. MK2]|uniref:hypothetical protein n=1 Tax=Sphingobium sp. MK2 TaxID=3116540 RepID=UPI0032E364C4